MFEFTPYRSALPSARRPVGELLEGRFFEMSGRCLHGQVWPPVDIVEDEGVYRLMADVPGMAPEALRVTVEKGILCIAGEVAGQVLPAEAGHVHLERRYGAFERRFRLPRGTRPDCIDASYRDGVLTVTVARDSVRVGREIAIDDG